MFNSIEFADPIFFYLLLLVPLFLFLNRKFGKHSALKYSAIDTLKNIQPSWRQKFKFILTWLQMLAFVLLIIGMARPQTRDTQSSITTEGIDIMLALDISGSMRIEDMGNMNRIDAAKYVAERFVRGRQSDRVGLVVFAGKSFTQCPLTVDYGILISLIHQVNVGMVEDGTAIGMGLVNAINRLRDSKAKSKVIILLTDGENNRGEIDPLTAAQIAQALGIRVYTIAAGKNGMARIPVDDPFFGKQYVTAEVKIDEASLRNIADITGGKFFHATEERALEDIYDQIGQLEKTKIELRTYLHYDDLYPAFVIPALFLLMVQIILRRTYFFSLP
jgi:Ca-activated chloride channel family protein